MVTLQDIEDAAEKSANAKYSAIYLRDLKNVATTFISENPRSPINTDRVVFSILSGFYKVLHGSSNNDKSIYNILTSKFGISDVQDYDTQSSDTKKLLELLIKDLISSDEPPKDFEIEINKLEKRLKPRKL